MSRGWVENGGCRITVAPGHLAKEIMLKKSSRHIRLFLCGFHFGVLSLCARSLRVDRLPTTNGPVTSDVATRSSFGSILQTFFGVPNLCVWRPTSRYRKPNRVKPTALVCVRMRSIVNISLQVGFGILNA